MIFFKGLLKVHTVLYIVYKYRIGRCDHFVEFAARIYSEQ